MIAPNGHAITLPPILAFKPLRKKWIEELVFVVVTVDQILSHELGHGTSHRAYAGNLGVREKHA